MTSNLGDFDENDGPVVRFFYVTTKEIKKLPEPVVEYSVVWNGLAPELPPSTSKSAASTLQLLHQHLPVLPTVLRLHHTREKLDEKPDKRSWTIMLPRIGIVLFHVVVLLSHARLANGLLPSPLVKKLNATHKLINRAITLTQRVRRDDISNADYLDLYYEVVPKALDTMTKLLGLVEAERAEGYSVA